MTTILFLVRVTDHLCLSISTSLLERHTSPSTSHFSTHHSPSGGSTGLRISLRPGAPRVTQQLVTDTSAARAMTRMGLTFDRNDARRRTIRISCRGRLQDLHAARNQHGGPGQLHPLVSPRSSPR